MCRHYLTFSLFITTYWRHFDAFILRQPLARHGLVFSQPSKGLSTPPTLGGQSLTQGKLLYYLHYFNETVYAAYIIRPSRTIEIYR